MDSVIRKTVPIPVRMAGLPRDHRGFIVPKFVAFIDGKPDFRVADTRHLVECVKKNLCYLCGQPMGTFKCYTIGPMCAVNRTISEPPSHRECATYSVQVCPFLSQPRMRRNEKDLPEERQEPAGVGLKRNPGMAVLWIERNPPRPFKVGGGNGSTAGVLFQLSDPVEVQWWKHGRVASREEAEEALTVGAPAVRDIAIAEGNGAIDAFDRMYEKARTYLPVPA